MATETLLTVEDYLAFEEVPRTCPRRQAGEGGSSDLNLHSLLPQEWVLNLQVHFDRLQ